MAHHEETTDVIFVGGFFQGGDFFVQPAHHGFFGAIAVVLVDALNQLTARAVLKFDFATAANDFSGFTEGAVLHYFVVAIGHVAVGVVAEGAGHLAGDVIDGVGAGAVATAAGETAVGVIADVGFSFDVAIGAIADALLDGFAVEIGGGLGEAVEVIGVDAVDVLNVGVGFRNALL